MVGRADARAKEKLERQGLLAASRRTRLFEGNQNAVLLAPGPNAVLIDEGEPESRIFGQGKIKESFVAWQHLETRLSEHDAVVGDDGVESDAIDAGRQELRGL